MVERTFAWLNQFRRLRIRYEKRADIHETSYCWGVRSSVGTSCDDEHPVQPNIIRLVPNPLAQHFYAAGRDCC